MIPVMHDGQKEVLEKAIKVIKSSEATHRNAVEKYLNLVNDAIKGICKENVHLVLDIKREFESKYGRCKWI